MLVHITKILWKHSISKKSQLRFKFYFLEDLRAREKGKREIFITVIYVAVEGIKCTVRIKVTYDYSQILIEGN
jgi:hypothetical protein